jgi:hypothetical protein
MKKVKVKRGQWFYAVVRHSHTIGGTNVTGRKIGPFVATRDSTSLGVNAGDRFFCRQGFKIETES